MRTIAFLLALISLALAAIAQPLHVIWDRSGAGDSSRYGYEILPLGDQNQDGYADWAVFALGGQGDSSMLEFFHGGRSMPTRPYLVQHFPDFDSSGAYRDMGVLGDVNGDSCVDWYEVRLRRNPRSYPEVEIYWGGAVADTIPDLHFAMESFDEAFPVGDFNGDGFADLFWYHDRTANYGQVLFGGSAMDTLPDWTIHMMEGSGWQPLPWGHGDLNGDGFGDWVSTAMNSFTTYVFLGGAQPDTVPAYTWPQMAWPQGIVRSLNGDRYDDLVLHASQAGPICLGGPTLHPQPDITLSFLCSSPDEAVSAGDFNHDGFQDLIPLTDYCAENNWEVLSLYLGHPSMSTQPAFTIEGWTPPLNLVGIWTAAGLGDVNGDGIDDIAIGAVDDVAYAGWRGRCIILAGDTTLRVDADPPFILHPFAFSLSVSPNPFNASARISFSLPKSGDVTVQVFDVTGRLVQTLVHQKMQAGEHEVRFDGNGLSSGLYFLRVETGDAARTQKLMLLK